jgi:hypothetical protein
MRHNAILKRDERPFGSELNLIPGAVSNRQMI